MIGTTSINEIEYIMNQSSRRIKPAAPMPLFRRRKMISRSSVVNWPSNSRPDAHGNDSNALLATFKFGKGSNDQSSASLREKVWEVSVRSLGDSYDQGGKPTAPRGCPSAIAPPFTLNLLASSLSSRSQ